jgi:hypothetical protein
MSDDNPEPRDEEPPYKGGGGGGFFMLLGVVVGAIALYALYFGTTAGIAPDEGYKTPLAGPAVFIPIGVYLAIAGALAVWPRTSRLGAGLLIGLGIFTLMGGGVCVISLSQMSRQI